MAINQIIYTNGILTDYKGAQETAMEINRLTGIETEIIHNASTPLETAGKISALIANGIIHFPANLSPEINISEAEIHMEKLSVSSFPIVKNKKVVGILTSRDLRSVTNFSHPVSSIMTKNVISASERISLDQAKKIMTKNKIEKLVIVNKRNELKGLITYKDITKVKLKPNACKDSYGRLRVAAGVGVTADVMERVEALYKAEVDAIIIDTAHGHSKGVIDTLKNVKKHYPDLEVVVGN
ncbi:MAG: IMP dehydrogenase, partial [Simkaniaceae bacterium]|nr:IMP dehydrogenase [Simkaniaceae bacterium]